MSSAPPVFADEERVLQVLNELVGNAHQVFRVRTRRSGWRAACGWQRTNDAGANEVCFIVEDQGRGIAPEKLERIFERFQQGDAIGLARAGRDGAGAGAVPQHCGAARRAHLGGERSGQGQQVSVHAAGGGIVTS